MLILKYDNKFWIFMSKVVDLVVLSLLGFIGCLPILTIGRSINAMMCTFRDLDLGKNATVIGSFIQYFKIKRWFVWPTLSVILMLTNLYAALFILFNGNLNVVFYLAFFMYIYLLITNIYIFPLQINGVLEKFALIRWAIYIAVKNMSYTILLALINGILLVLLTFIAPYLFPIVMGMTLWRNYKVVNYLIILKEYNKLFEII